MAEEEEKDQTEATAAEEQDAPEAEAAVEPAPEAEAAVEPAPEAEAGEPAAQLSPKERRRLERSAHSGEAGPELSTEERIERRLAERKRKAAERSRYRKGRGASRAKAAGKGSGTGSESAEREPGNPKVRCTAPGSAAMSAVMPMTGRSGTFSCPLRVVVVVPAET